MAEQRIEVDTRALNNDIQEIEAGVRTVQRDLKHMFDEVQEMNGMWKGQANQAYQTQFQSDYEMMDTMAGELLEYVEALRTARETYERCESEVEELVRSIRI